LIFVPTFSHPTPHFLLKHENELVGNAGAVFNSINKTQIKNISIPLPPLSEQKRIVAILDEAFESIAKAKEKAGDCRESWFRDNQGKGGTKK